MFRFWDCGCKDIQQIQKDIPGKKFLETLSFVLPAKTTVGLIVKRTVVLAGRTKFRVSKNFLLGEIFLYLLNIFATALPKPKSKQKISKIIVQILAIVNHQNWLDDSPPLRKQTRKEKKLKTKPWITRNILKSIQHKNNLYKQCLKQQNAELWQSYKQYRNKVTHSKEIAKQDYFQKLISENKQNTSQLRRPLIK